MSAVRVRIHGLAFGGDAVGKDATGRVVFVPGGVPGDELTVRMVEEKRRYARGEIETIDRPSSERVQPPCPLFAAGCGGCPWMNVALATQRRAKRETVERALAPLAMELEPLESPVAPLGWRRRARLAFSPGPGGPIVGYRRRRSRQLLDVAECPQLEGSLQAVLVEVREALAGALRGHGEISLVAGAGTGAHVGVSGDTARRLRAPAEGLLGRQGISGLVLSDALGSDVFGAPRLDLADGPHPHWVSASTFVQSSAEGSRTLRRAVLAESRCRDGQRVLELYAGSGNYTRDLASLARVTAVEESAPACELGRENTRAVRQPVDWVAGSASSVTQAMAARGERFDLVVVNPPRTGLEAGVVESVARLRPARLVYVSCDPMTLARDLRALAGQGLKPRRALPLDLMPQTSHVELVASLDSSP